MPTVLCIDCSFSMYQTASSMNEKETKLKLAETCCVEIINHLSNQFKMEHFAILSFSSKVQEICEFTRDCNLLKTALNNISLGDKSSFKSLSKFVNGFVQKEWGCMQPCNIIVITDGRLFADYDLLTSDASSDTSHSADVSCIFDFDCHLHFICIEYLQTLKSNGVFQSLQDIVKRAGGHGSVKALLNNSMLTKSIEDTTRTFLDEQFKSFEMTLQCGCLSGKVVLYPPPHSPELENLTSSTKVLEIVGFLNIPDVGNPPVISRHLLLAVADETSAAGAEADSSCKTKPCFSVVLHGSLKTESKLALVRVMPDWFGIVCSWTGGKNKSNLVLSLFSRCYDCLPWLGDFRSLGPASSLPVNTSGKHNTLDLPTFPIQKKGVKRSYAQPTVAWTRPTGLQADLQKILRSAKKLPEKSQVFYKDLNRLRRAALAFGFHDLLEGISSLLERECTLMPGTAHPEATLQLSHAAEELKASITLGYDHTLVPLKTDFKSHGSKS